MEQPLQGWDLATWRVTQSQSGLAANVVATVEVAGIIDPNLIAERVENLISIYPSLAMAVSDTEPAHLYPILDFASKKYISVSQGSVGRAASRLANLKIGPNECLWRIELIFSNKKTYILCAINHTIADGNTAMQLMKYLFDNPTGTIFEFKTKKENDDFVNNLKTAASELVGRLTKDPVGLAKDISDLTQSVSRLIGVNKVGKEIASTKDLQACFYKIDSRQIANLTQGNQISSHDVMVALIVGAIARFNVAKSIDKETLLINIPVAMNINDASANKILVARLEFPAKNVDATYLMALSRENLRKWRQEPGLKIVNSLISASQFLPIDLIVRSLRASDATVSTLVGQSHSSRLFGFEVKGVWPLLAPVGAGLNCTCVITNGYLHIGICIDPNVISEFDVWQRAFQSSADEVFGQELFEQIFE
ncbi:MAG: hypothetical protein RJA41_886 [Actinomycetota bacterium]